MNRRIIAGIPVAKNISIAAGIAIALQSFSAAAIAEPAPTKAATKPAATATGVNTVSGAAKKTSAPVTGAAKNLLSQGKAELAAGHFDKAIALLTDAASAVGTVPASSETRFYLGKALCEKAKKLKAAKSPDANKTFLAARKELRASIRYGRGSDISKQANVYMMANLPSNLTAPRTGDGTELIAARFGLHGQHRGAGGVAKAQIFEFFAPWCSPCQQLKPVLAKMQKQYSEQVEVKSFNVDDDAAQDIVDQYEVSPIPTVIFLTPDSKVVAYSIGYSGEKMVQKQLQKILPAGSPVAAGTPVNKPAARPNNPATAAGAVLNGFFNPTVKSEPTVNAEPSVQPSAASPSASQSATPSATSPSLEEKIVR